MDRKMGKVSVQNSFLSSKKEELNNKLEQIGCHLNCNDFSSKSQTNSMESKHSESPKSTHNAGKVLRKIGPSILQQKIKERRNPLAWRFAKRNEKLEYAALKMEVEVLEQLTELRENQLNMLTEFKRTLGSELFEIKKSLDNQVYYLQSITSCLEELASQEAERNKNENQNN